MKDLSRTQNIDRSRILAGGLVFNTGQVFDAHDTPTLKKYTIANCFNLFISAYVRRCGFYERTNRCEEHFIMAISARQRKNGRNSSTFIHPVRFAVRPRWSFRRYCRRSYTETSRKNNTFVWMRFNLEMHLSIFFNKWKKTPCRANHFKQVERVDELV